MITLLYYEFPILLPFFTEKYFSTCFKAQCKEYHAQELKVTKQKLTYVDLRSATLSPPPPQRHFEKYLEQFQT